MTRERREARLQEVNLAKVMQDCEAKVSGLQAKLKQAETDKKKELSLAHEK